jgi:uncharacterized protein (DUF2147 family)
VQTLTQRYCARSLRRAACAALLVIALSSFAVPGAAVSAIVPEGAWFIDGAAAVQIFDCSGELCGRIIWLRTARDTAGDTAGRLVRDNKNPEPASRHRPLCGLTILQGLQPAGLDHWNSGSLYNPEDGQTYRVSAELRSADVFVARIYMGVPLFGETKTLLRAPRLRSEGWC